MIARPWRWPLAARLGALSVAVAVLLWLSLAPTDDLPGAELIWDKAEHAIAYVVLMMVGQTLFPAAPLRFAAFALALGGAIELMQATMGFGRQGDWRDLLANSLGVAAGLVLGQLVRRAVRR